MSRGDDSTLRNFNIETTEARMYARIAQKKTIVEYFFLLLFLFRMLHRLQNKRQEYKQFIGDKK